VTINDVEPALSVEEEAEGDVVVVVGVVVDVVGAAVVGVVVDGVVVDVVASLAGVVVLVVSLAGVEETVVDGVVVEDVTSARAAPAGPAAMTRPARDAAPKERNRVRNVRDAHVDLAAVPTRAKRPRWFWDPTIRPRFHTRGTPSGTSKANGSVSPLARPGQR
jgi:hypothetical protein